MWTETSRGGLTVGPSGVAMSSTPGAEGVFLGAGGETPQDVRGGGFRHHETEDPRLTVGSPVTLHADCHPLTSCCGSSATVMKGHGKTYVAPRPSLWSDPRRGRGIMTEQSHRRRAWSPEYRIRVTFRAPLDFAFAWCTDFTPKDARLEGESYERKIIEHTPRLVMFEDLEESETGWIWSREVVSLHPPNRWHMDGIGNRRDVTADYVLSSLPDGRTQLELRWRRRSTMPEERTLTMAEREASSTRAWKRFGTAMERDYRRSRRGQRRRTK